MEVRARARRLARQCGQLGLIIIDYMQLMSGNSSGENRATEISEISRSLKSLAKELNCPLIALSQLNRSLEQRPNKRPVMSDLRESGAIRSVEHTSELQSLMRISYAVFCLKKKNKQHYQYTNNQHTHQRQ